MQRDGHAAVDWFAVPSTSVPSALRGVFWADGNWDPSLLNFATARWDGGPRVMTYKTYGVDAWASTTRLSQSTCCCGTYIIYFDEELKVGDIHTSFDWPCLPLLCCAPHLRRRHCCAYCLPESCTCIADFKMTQNDPDTWVRDSTMCKACCGPKLKQSYTLKRVLDETGAKTKHYDEMAKSDKTSVLYTRTPCPCYMGCDATHYAQTQARAKVAPASGAPPSVQMAR